MSNAQEIYTINTINTINSLGVGGWVLHTHLMGAVLEILKEMMAKFGGGLDRDFNSSAAE